MIRHPYAAAVLGELGLDDVFFPNANAEERDEYQKRIIRFVAFGAGRKESQVWFRRMDPDKPVHEILGDMIEMVSFERPIDGLQRGPYHHFFMDLAILEGATGLDLTSNNQLARAAMTYWNAVKKTIEMFKKQVEIKREDAQKFQVPPLAPEFSVEPQENPAIVSDDLDTAPTL